MSSIALIEFFFRAGAGALMLMMALLLARQAWHLRAARFGAILSICITAGLVVHSGEGTQAVSPAVRAILFPLNTNGVLFIWWFSRALLVDDFELRWWDYLAALVWNGLALFNVQALIFLEPIAYPLASLGRNLIAGGVVGHIIYVAIAGRAGDLIESRRRVRTRFAGTITALFVVSLWSEGAFGYATIPLWLTATQYAMYMAVSVWSFLWLARIDTSALIFEPAPQKPAPEKVISAREQSLKDKLLGAVETDKAYLDPGLTIGGLAGRIGAPEHQVRALINKSLGHRNFRAFLNGYRLDVAKAALADPGKAGLPILTIAMDSGFASLAPFNRAFKEALGETPTAYRNRALGVSGDDAADAAASPAQ